MSTHFAYLVGVLIFPYIFAVRVEATSSSAEAQEVSVCALFLLQQKACAVSRDAVVVFDKRREVGYARCEAQK